MKLNYIFSRTKIRDFSLVDHRCLALPVIPGEILHDSEFFMKVFRSEIQSQRTVSVVMEGMMSFDPKMLQIYMSLLS